MLSKNDKERTKLLVVTDAEMRSSEVADVINVAHRYIFEYFRSKEPSIPSDIFVRESFDSESGIISSELIKQDDLKMWIGRLSEPDSTVPGRSWHLELTTGKVPSGHRFGSRLSCFSRNLDFDFDPAVPRVYRQLASQGILFGDGAKLTTTPVDITNEDDVDWLLALINNPRRWRNVIAIAVDEQGIFSLDGFVLSNRLCGAAHVVRIFPEASYLLSDRIDKYLSVFDYGVRIYRPTSNVEEDDPHRHPLFTKQHISRVDSDRLLKNVALDSFKATVEGNLARQAIPTFAQIRSANATLRLAATRNQNIVPNVHSLETQLEAALTARKAFEVQAEESLALAIQEEKERTRAEAERDQERGRSAAMSARIRALERQIASAQYGIQSTPRPSNYQEMAHWIQSEFAGRIQLTGKALRGLRDAQYEDIALVCDILELLATSYVNSKRGTQSAWRTFEEEIVRWGVEFSKSISGTRAGEQGDEYYVLYRGQKQFLEWHLKKGNSRDPRRDLRIYFFWDEEEEEVVLGYLTGHLDNRFT